MTEEKLGKTLKDPQEWTQWRDHSSGSPGKMWGWKEVTDWEEIEPACLDENQTRFLQLTQEQTPFNMQPLLEEFGYLAIGEE